jgi:hypothetical protein
MCIPDSRHSCLHNEKRSQCKWFRRMAIHSFKSFLAQTCAFHFWSTPERVSGRRRSLTHLYTLRFYFTEHRLKNLRLYSALLLQLTYSERFYRECFLQTTHSLRKSTFEYTTLSKRYQTLFFSQKTSDGMLANLITVVEGGGTFMSMRDLMRPRPVRFSLLS